MVTYAEQSKERLVNNISYEIKDLFEKFLDYLELITDDNDKLKKVRSKVLRNGNNSIRRLSRLVDENYVIAYDPKRSTEDIIQVKPINIDER